MKAKNNQVEKKQTLSSRDKKHQARLKNNSSLHFQIGLIVVLFMVFGLFQVEFEKEIFNTPPVAMNPEDDGIIVPQDWIIEQPKVDQPKVDNPVVRKPTTIFEVVSDDSELKKILPIVNTPVENTPLKVNDLDVPDELDDVGPIPLNTVQILPLFPGCERFKTKKEKMTCFMGKVSNHINNKFDTEIAADNDITGMQRIFVMFTINAEGEIVDIKARSPYEVLEKEAIKAVQSLPKMTPAKQGYKKVAVSYTLPINFVVE